MRSVNGYVFISDFGYREVIFGKKVNESDGDYENFQTNGLTPYDSHEDAEVGNRDFNRRRGGFSGHTARVEMLIAENQAELDCFRDSSSLVVIMKEHDVLKIDRLLGPRSHGKPGLGSLPGAYLCLNGLATFEGLEERSAYERALDLLREVNRQGDCAATIAKLELTK